MRTVLHERYEVISELGKGGTSRVYLCIDNHIHKKWAIKQIDRHGIDLSVAEHEINNLKELDYYLFPRITDAFTEGNYIYIVTDYIDGKTLDQVLKERKHLPESVVIDYLKELIKGLLYLHSQSPPIFYLDMKPANIMLCADGRLKLIDFGIAQSAIEESLSLGTPGYAPPEQYIKGTALTEKADVFALAITAFTLLTGQKPYKNYDIQISCVKKSCISKHMKDILLKSLEYDESFRLSLKDFNSEISHYLGNDRKLKVITATLLLVSFVFCLSTGVVAGIFQENKKKEAAKKMVELSEMYIEDGEYTKEGIKIIRGYIDGNFLDSETAEYFTYEVARNLFEIQADYALAGRYFERLDCNKYPEVRYFLQLCKCMTSFSNEEDIADCIRDFREYNLTVRDKEKRAKNDELIKLIELSGGKE